MPRFLYGAAVQGIQSFILQTNKLREIVGASEMVAQICTRLFYEFCTGMKFDRDDHLAQAMEEDTNFILHAAGNIKYVFEDKSVCEKVVKGFPRLVMEYAPGITISQAVEEYDTDFQAAVEKLEQKLAIQRNRPSRSMTLGLMGIRRSQQTGLPVSVTRNGEDLDRATAKKREASDLSSLFLRAIGEVPQDAQIAYDVSDLASDSNSWIAVIHADGNGLGSIVRRIGGNQKRFKKFSEELDKATVAASRQAYTKICSKLLQGQIVPIRPVVLSGDDFTVLCRADLAIDYTRAFLEAFEEKTMGLLTEGDKIFTQGSIRNRMTACAGIAFVKASYPFYYAYSLAEDLCNAAKRDAKDTNAIKEGIELPQSCLLFHKVQDSFNEDYKEVIARELTPSQELGLNFGPYYLHEKKNRWTIEKLQKMVGMLKGNSGNAIKTTIRQWLTLLYEHNGQEKQMIARAKTLYKEKDELFHVLETATTPTSGKVPAYEILVIETMTQ